VSHGLASLRDQARRGDPGLRQAARDLAEIMPPADERLISVVLTLWLNRSGETGGRLFREGLAIADTSLKTSPAWQAVRLIPQRMDALGRSYLSARQMLPETRSLVEALEAMPGAPAAALLFTYLFASQVTAEADDLGQCHSIVQRGLALAEQAGEAGAERIFRSSGLQISLASDDPLDVTVRLGETIRRDVEGVRSAQPMVHGVLAAAYAMQGLHDDAERVWLAADEPRSAIPEGVRAFVEIYRCQLAMAAGRTSAAAAAFEQLAADTTGAPLLRIELASCAARLHVFSGDSEGARRCAATARAYVADAGASGTPPQFEARLWILEAIFAALEPVGGLTRDPVDRARELRGTQGGPLARAYFDLDTAGLLYALGRAGEAEESAGRARDEFATKGARALVELADVWQTELGRLMPERRPVDVEV
jgi:hypothetical protein